MHDSTSRGCDYCLPSVSFQCSPLSHGDARGGERTNHHYTYTPVHPSPTSPDPPSTVALASMPGFSAIIGQSFESAEDPAYMQHHPAHPINQWFDRAGLSLDPALSGSASNAAGILSEFPSLDYNGCVSSFPGISCCGASLQVYRSISYRCRIARLWVCDNRDKFPRGPFDLQW